MRGSLPPEVWNRFGTKVLPKLRSGAELDVRIDLGVTVGDAQQAALDRDLRQLLEDLELTDRVRLAWPGAEPGVRTGGKPEGEE